jgi:ABC-type dipeptide/oligopeptide/nickel transport system ATPase component
MTQLAQQHKPSAAHTRPLLRVENLQVSFGPVRAVDGVSLSIFPRQTVAIVGESGCGKSMTALSVLRLIPKPGAITGGEIDFDGRDLTTLPRHEMLRVRGGEIAMIFQEPMSSLNPVFHIGDQIIEAIVLHQNVSARQAKQMAIQSLHDVGIANPSQQLRAYPHQFSGGMRQRVMIAMALACQPRLLLADEPTTALDVTIQAQILQLLHDLQRSRGMGIMFITHDLGIVAQHADVVCVMYAGRVVEYANVFDLFTQPAHPYTRALLKCRPSLRQRVRRLTTVTDLVTEAQGERLMIGGERVEPWWPSAGNHGKPSVLREIASDHCIACCSEADEKSAPAPHLSFCRSQASHA